MEIDPPFANDAVANAYAAFPDDVRTTLLDLRRMIFDVAADLPEVGRIEETLKWGQPSYLTPDTKSGTTIRLAVPKAGGAGIYTHCQTTVMSDFQVQFGDAFTFDGNRALHLPAEGALPENPLRLLIISALTYHNRSYLS